MKLLVACHECKRRYNATKSKIGSRFRCRCGTVVRVKSPKGHKARVVRCSSCGAARTKGSRACSHCSSDFTLHERDLHTVCPACLTRVSDGARFCHQCGTALSSDESLGEPTSSVCPACDAEAQLHSRQLGQLDVSALECDACAGLWLNRSVFEQLARNARHAESVSFLNTTSRLKQPDFEPPPQRRGYRPCPDCSELMSRKNYGLRTSKRGSGTIIDVCPLHGCWFDATELSRILNWLREGGMDGSRATAYSESKRKQSQRESKTKRFAWTTEISSSPSLGPSVSRMLDILFGKV